MAKVDVKFDLNKVDSVLRNAITKGLSTQFLKNEVIKLTRIEIEKVVNRNQNLFRPDKGDDGGNELVGLLGIGANGSPLTNKYSGKGGAWSLLIPGGKVAKLTSSFRKSAVSFANINYTIDIDKFFNDFRSTYISHKRGDSDFIISWMQNLIDGIPTEKIRDYPADESFVFVDSGKNFNPKLSRTGLGHMVPASRIKIPSRQFTFEGRGRKNTFGLLLDKMQQSLSSNSFKSSVEKTIAKSINSGG
jgi:hypothetical protein